MFQTALAGRSATARRRRTGRPWRRSARARTRRRRRPPPPPAGPTRTERRAPRAARPWRTRSRPAHAARASAARRWWVPATPRPSSAPSAVANSAAVTATVAPGATSGRRSRIHAALRGGAAQHCEHRRGGESPAGLAGVRDGVVAAGCGGPPGPAHERHHQRPGDRGDPGEQEHPGEPQRVDDRDARRQEQQLGQADRVAVARRRATVRGRLDQLRGERAPGDRGHPEPEPTDGGDRQHRTEVGGQREQRRREAEQQRPHDQHRTVPDPAQHRGHQQLGADGGRHQYARAQPRSELAGTAPGHPQRTTGSSRAYPPNASAVEARSRRNGSDDSERGTPHRVRRTRRGASRALAPRCPRGPVP